MTNRLCRLAVICIAALHLTGCGQEDRPEPAEQVKQLHPMLGPERVVYCPGVETVEEAEGLLRWLESHT